MDSETISDLDGSELLERLNTEAAQSLGMVMVFTLVSSALEWLNGRKDLLLLRKKEIHDRKLMAVEQEEQKRFEGTRVTVDTFLKWKKAFDDEMTIIKMKDASAVIEKGPKKLSGRELFERDSGLNDSDLQFLEEGDVPVSYDETGVKVDVSLFEDLEDLEIDEDDMSD